MKHAVKSVGAIVAILAIGPISCCIVDVIGSGRNRTRAMEHAKLYAHALSKHDWKSIEQWTTNYSARFQKQCENVPYGSKFIVIDMDETLFNLRIFYMRVFSIKIVFDGNIELMAWVDGEGSTPRVAPGDYSSDGLHLPASKSEH